MQKLVTNAFNLIAEVEEGVLSNFVEGYDNEEEKKEGIKQLLLRLNILNAQIQNKDNTNKKINITNPEFQKTVLKNKWAHDLLTSIGFVKEDMYYVKKISQLPIGFQG